MRTILRRLPGYAVARTAWHLLRGGDDRDVALLRLRRPDNLFQPFCTTSEDRYPQIFEAVAAELAGRPAPRLLSFGCAKGAEVAALHRRFPEARITGIDINPRNIAAARRRLDGTPGVELAVAASADGEADAAYDAVFAMAVFRHGELGGPPPAPRCGHLIRFAAFDRTVAGLARCLKPGGVLALCHANFLFADASCAAGFTPLLAMPAGATPLYDQDDRLRPPPPVVAVVWRKTVSAAAVPSRPAADPKT